MSVRKMCDFAYAAPGSVSEVLELLEGGSAMVMAGGTDLIPKMKGGVVKPNMVVSLRNVEELRTCSYSNHGLYFGAGVSIHDLERYAPVKTHYRALYEAVTSIASVQIRNSGTVVGNICNAVPSADSAPALLCYGAKLHVASKAGRRVVPIEEFFVGVCKTVLKSDELVLGIEIGQQSTASASCYLAHTQRRALDLAMVGVACKLELEDGVCREVKIALGAVAATPKLAAGAQEVLLGKAPSDEVIELAAKTAGQADCAPITDMRATEKYRRDMVEVLTKNTLLQVRAVLSGAAV